MFRLFTDCYALEKLNISNWDTSNVISMGSIFENCKKLIKIDISKWNTLNVTNIGYMFYGCSSLKDINIESFLQNQINDKQNANYFLGNDDELEYCRYSGDAKNTMTNIF